MHYTTLSSELFRLCILCMLMHTSTFNNFPNFLTFCLCFETYLYSQKWLHMILIQVLSRQRLVDLCAWGQCGIHTISREIRVLTQRNSVIKQSKRKQNTPPQNPKIQILNYYSSLHQIAAVSVYWWVDGVVLFHLW